MKPTADTRQTIGESVTNYRGNGYKLSGNQLHASSYVEPASRCVSRWLHRFCLARRSAQQNLAIFCSMRPFAAACYGGTVRNLKPDNTHEPRLLRKKHPVADSISQLPKLSRAFHLLVVRSLGCFVAKHEDLLKFQSAKNLRCFVVGNEDRMNFKIQSSTGGH